MNTVIKLNGWERDFFLSARVRGQIDRWSVRRAKTIFADDFSAAIILLAAGKAIVRSNFPVLPADFRDHSQGRQTLIQMGRGNPYLDVLPCCEAMSACKNVTLDKE